MKPFRFGIMAPPQPDSARWLATARRAEVLGYDTLVVPDGLRSLSALPALAFAAGATTKLKFGTFVLAAPLRPSRLVAWDAHTISVLSGGRFELGLGAGLPETGREAKDEIGLPELTPAERLERIKRTIEELRTLDKSRYTPVMVAAGGPKARALAAAYADIITLASGPLISRQEIAAQVADIRSHAGDRFDDIELAHNIFAVGEQVPPELLRFAGADAATLIKHRSLTILTGTPGEMADELRERRMSLGFSYIIVNATFMEAMAPVVELLAGT